MLLFFLCVYSVYLVRYVTIPVLSIIAPRKDEGLLSGATTCHKEIEREREKRDSNVEEGAEVAALVLPWPRGHAAMIQSHEAHTADSSDCCNTSGLWKLCFALS